MGIFTLYFFLNHGFLEKPKQKNIQKPKTAKTEKTGKACDLKNNNYHIKENDLFGPPPICDTIVDNGILKSDYLEIRYTFKKSIYSQLDILMRRYHPLCGAAAVLEATSGHVLALYEYRNKGVSNSILPPSNQHLALYGNYPCASIIKIVTAGAVMDLGLLNPWDYIGFTGNAYTLYKMQLKNGLKQYMNYITLQDAFARSVNPAFGRIGIQYLGNKNIINYAKRFGFNQSPCPELSCNPSTISPGADSYAVAELACGFNEKTTLSPLHGALIACCVVNNGLAFVPVFTKKITNLKKGTELEMSHTKKWIAPLSETSAKKLRMLMEETTIAGTARKGLKDIVFGKKFIHLKVGGKTGSLDSKIPKGRCDWFVGYAYDPQMPKNKLALAVVTLHGNYWNVKSSYIASEIIRSYFNEILAH